MEEDPSNMNLSAIRRTPLFSYHGAADNLQPLKNVENTFKYLKEKIYVGEHEQNWKYINEEGLRHFMSPTGT